MKVALYKDITYKHAVAFPSGESFESMEGYARVSEFVDIEFPALTTDAVVKQQLDALDRAEGELRRQFQMKLDGIENRRAELKAITFVPADE